LIEEWLGFVKQAALLETGLAIEVAECATLLKGYGETYKRGQKNFRTIMTQLVDPALMPERDVDADRTRIAQARAAALADPDGVSLAKVLNPPPKARPALAAASD
jgi:indolepyruvate ferredoxin oxidoreductase beta subunit